MFMFAVTFKLVDTCCTELRAICMRMLFFYWLGKEACVNFDVLVSMYLVMLMFIYRSKIVIVVMIVVLILVTNSFSSLGHQF
jgi:hypothetical protein